MSTTLMHSPFIDSSVDNVSLLTSTSHFDIFKHHFRGTQWCTTSWNIFERTTVRIVGGHITYLLKWNLHLQ